MKKRKAGQEDGGVSLKEYIAYQYFFEHIPSLKAKIAKYRFLDKQTFLDIVADFFRTDRYCQSNKVKMDERTALTLFKFLDIDGSGELEPEEFEMFELAMVGQSRDAKAKNDALALLMKLQEQAFAKFI